jgi:hypothetical protein
MSPDGELRGSVTMKCILQPACDLFGCISLCLIGARDEGLGGQRLNEVATHATTQNLVGSTPNRSNALPNSANVTAASFQTDPSLLKKGEWHFKASPH